MQVFLRCVHENREDREGPKNLVMELRTREKAERTRPQRQDQVRRVVPRDPHHRGFHVLLRDMQLDDARRAHVVRERNEVVAECTWLGDQQAV